MVPQQQITSHQLANGMTVVIESMPDVQSAAFSLLVPSGSNYDAPGREGEASILSDWIMRGAGPRDSMQLTNDLDFLGLQRSESVGNIHLSFNGAMVAENLPAALGIYADVVQRPHLPDEEFEAAQAGVEQSLRAIHDEPRQRVMLELRKRCYAAPWGLPSEGSLEGVEASTAAGVRGHFERCARPGEAILGIAGKVNVPATIDLVERLFSDWKPRPAPAFAVGPAGPGRDHLPHDSTQTQIGVAYKSVPYRDPDYYAAWAAVGVLSGGMSARLFTEVREKRGLCYSVYASLNSLRDEGRVLCYAGTTAERAQETLDVLVGELVRLGDGIDASELVRCQARAKSSLIMQQESSSARAGSIARDWFHLGRVTTLEEVRSKIDALTVDSLLAHIHQYPAQDFTILTLGPEPLEVHFGVP